MQKICSKCKTIKDLDNFGLQDKARQIYKSVCKSCVKQYNQDRYKEDKDSFKQNAEKWAAENRIKYLENQKAYNAIRPKTRNVGKNS
jgi:hypothetical protein